MNLVLIGRYLRERPAVSLLAVAAALTSVGIVMIYSAGTVYAEYHFDNRYHFVYRQLLHLLLGIAALVLASKYPYQKYKNLVPLLMLVTFVLMVLVLIPGVGLKVGNARRWIRFMGFGIQPSEPLKFILIVWMAGFLEHKRRHIPDFSQTLLPSLAMIATFCMLLLLQPDFGTAVLIATSLMLMIFVAGLKPLHMIISVAGMAGIGAFLIATKSYRLRRITGFLDPWADPLDSGFQLIQSLIAFGTGGIFGRGLGNSKQKLFFLPESHSDFIFSIIAEETGFVGVAIVTGLFLVLAFKGIRIALECENDFGRNLAFGITIMIVLQSLFNIGVVVGLLPTKGIPLPFISYGGSSLVVNMLMIGVLINISGGGKPKS